MELQHWWANRERLLGWNAIEAENYTAEQIANGEHQNDFDLGIDSIGRLTGGGAGEIIFGGAPVPTGDFDKDGDLDVDDI